MKLSSYLTLLTRPSGNSCASFPHCNFPFHLTCLEALLSLCLTVVEQVGLGQGNTQVSPSTVHRQTLKVGQEGKQPCLPLCKCFKEFGENWNLPGTVVHALVLKEAGQPGPQGEPCLKTNWNQPQPNPCLLFFSDCLCRQMTFYLPSS